MATLLILIVKFIFLNDFFICNVIDTISFNYNKKANCIKGGNIAKIKNLSKIKRFKID